MTMKEFTIRCGLFMGGIALGAGAAYLTAPESGKQVRKRISRSLEDGADYLNHKSKSVSRQVESVLDRSKDLASRFVS